MSDLDNKIINATKWSAIAEIIAKLITPITNMILARIIAPEEFGVIATITMIISFADMFTDAGFQKYLIQHEFESEEFRTQSINVAFWTNLVISIFLWIVIAIFSEQIATMVGIPSLGYVISLACIQLPLTSFSSIQMAIYRRSFDFKTLFSVRLAGICIPFIVTIPLALLGYSYWSLIIGTICGTLANAIILTIKSPWKPQKIYKISVLKKMISFSIWSLIESLSIWLTNWIDTFIIASALSSYYLGVYNTSLTVVNSIFMLVTASTTSILFSALSRVQNDERQFNSIFLSMQRSIAYLVIPMSIGIYIYSDVVVKILLGDKWVEASSVIGVWGLISGITIVLGHYSSEIYRAKGKPKLSFLAQMIHLAVLVPICILSSKHGFMTLVNNRALVRLQLVLTHMIILRYIIGISIKSILMNVYIPCIASIIMGLFGMILRSISNSLIWQLSSIFMCILFYILVLMIIKVSREDIKKFINKIIIRNNFSKNFKLINTINRVE
ncbi:lipopolysaccharide biosynthesis protein [Paraclostridium bifermentans]|uniref:lipopolysaccharide biosynthesis protein n=1 Tax=Paraclostridium bifermentans TaxID=1490 RepID=UPI0022E1A556|nr:lipopolysaccharide biosynthesis protein [Paraclostridium bifermentans]